MTTHAMTAHFVTAHLLHAPAPAAHWLAVRDHVTSTFFLSIALGRFSLQALLAKIRYALYRASERLYEWRLGILSDAEILMDKFGIFDEACHHYSATGYIRFRQLMKLIPIRAGEDVFLDFGSGMGRAIVLAAALPFRKVIGVELIPDLHTIARDNVRRALPRLCCRDIELHNVDAVKFIIPPDVTVIYLWNPFSGHVLEQVFANIRQSIQEFPRAVTILHLSPSNPTCLDTLKDRLPWLNEHKRISLGAQSLAVIYTCGAAVLNGLTI